MKGRRGEEVAREKIFDWYIYILKIFLKIISPIAKPKYQASTYDITKYQTFLPSIFLVKVNFLPIGFQPYHKHVFVSWISSNQFIVQFNLMPHLGNRVSKSIHRLDWFSNYVQRLSNKVLKSLPNST
jgi:hypothetical protein